MQDGIFSGVDEYIGKLFAPEDDSLVRARQRISAAGMQDISVTASQGKLLHVLAVLGHATRILEIGTLGGYSAIWLARALPPDGRLITIELEEEHAAVAKRNIAQAGLESKVEIRIGDAVDVMKVMVSAHEEPFDMIFIDADKTAYVAYLELSLRLARSGALIVADNVIRSGEVLNPGTEDPRVKGIQRFNSALAGRSDLASIMLQTVGPKGHDGMALAVVGSR